MTNDQLISAAENALFPHTVKGRLFGDVGAAIYSASGRLFVGVLVDTPPAASTAHIIAALRTAEVG